MKCSQLPDLILFNGDWHPYFLVVYKAFCEDFIDYKPSFRGKKLALKRHPLIDGKEYTFYHFSHSGVDENERTPDFRRCERIKYPRKIIENCDNWKLKIWNQDRNGKKRLCIWLELEDNMDYIVILDIRKNYILPWTAFVLEHQHQKNKKLKEYNEYKKQESLKN